MKLFPRTMAWAAVLLVLALLRPALLEGGDAWKLSIVAVAVKGQKCYVELADEPLTRQRGLMFRSELEDDRGMLFVYPEPRPLQFWMKNTYLPLSIAFIDSEGFIVNIEDMEPLDVKSRTKSLRPVPYALEVNRGWFATRGIQSGDKVVFLKAYRRQGGSPR